MPKFIMMVGLPASGKSTYVNEVLYPQFEGQPTVVLSSDNIIDEIAIATHLEYSDVFQDVIGPAIAITEANLQLYSMLGANIILDQTNLDKKSRKKKLSSLRNYDIYEKVAVVLTTPNKEMDKRLKKRTSKIIPKDTIKSMRNRFTLPETDEGFDTIIKV